MTWAKWMLKNKGVWLALTVLFLCYFSASINLWISSITEPVIAYRPSAFIYALEAILFGGVILVFPFCAYLPIVLNKVMLVNDNSSIMKKVIYSFVSGGTVVTVPFVLHTIFWNILALPVDPVHYEGHQLQLFGLLNDLYDKCYGIPVYTIFAFGMFLAGGTYAVMYLATSVWLTDRIIAFSIPSIIYLSWLKVSTFCPNLQLPAPVDLFDEGLTIRSGCYLVLIYLAVLLLCSKLYFIAQKKEKHHE